MRCRAVSALVAGLVLLGSGPVQAAATWWIEPAMQTCRAWGVPPSLAMSVILAESGGQPYAIRVNAGGGRVMVPRSREDAARMAEAAVRVTPNVDLGLMQVNYREWGKPLGLTPAQLVDPEVNLEVGCAVLKLALAAGGADWQRVGRYHSPDPVRQRLYAAKVAGWLQALLAPPDRRIPKELR